MIKKITKRTIAVLLFGILSTHAHAITLKQVVQEVIEKHPSVLAAKAGQMFSHYTVKQAYGNFLPKILFRITRGSEISGNSVVRGTGSLDRTVTMNRQEHSLNFTQMIFDGYRSRAEVNEQHFNLKASEYSLSLARQLLMKQVAEAYLNVLRARERIILARSNIEAHEKALKHTKLRFEAGAGTKGEVELAESRFALARIRLNSSLGSLEQANAIYFSIVTKPPSLIMEKPPSLRKYLPKTVKQAVKLAMQFNPEINISKSDMASANEAIHVARSSMFPRLDLEVNATDNNNIDGVIGRNRDLTALLVMNYAIFNGGQDLALLNQARTKRLQTLHNVNTMRRQVLQSVTRNWADLQTNLKDYHNQRDYVIKAKRVVADYVQQFGLGKRALFNVLDAENELFRARVGLAEAYYNARIDTYNILASIGTLSPNIL